jgi:hypothetical protein
MAGGSQCSHCAAAPGPGANYCSECGTPQTLIVFDPLGVEDAPVISGTDMAPHARLTMLAGLLLVFAMLAVLWGLSRQGDPADDAPLSSETQDQGILAADPATSTTAVATTASTTTGASTTASEQLFVNDVPGPVLGDGVDGVLIHISVQTMRQIDLATGAIELIALEHPVLWGGPESGIVVNGKLVAIRGSVITITDLSDGSQRELIDVIDRLFEMHVAGQAGVDSVWLATYPEPDQTSGAIEVGLDGEVRHRVQIPRPFKIRWADGDELILGSVDGSFLYDTVTWATVRMPGTVVALAPGFVITASCKESLQCDVLVDRGNGPEVVDWPSANELFNGSLDGSIDVSPDLSGALVHVYGEQGGGEFSYVDLHTGSRVDLGHLPIEPYRGVVWVEGSRWIIGQDEFGNMTLAIDTETGTQLDLDTETGTQLDLDLPSLIGSSSFMAFIPSN